MVEDHESDPNVLHLCCVKDANITEIIDTFPIFYPRRFFNEKPLAF